MSDELPWAEPEAIGWDAERLRRAEGLLDRWTRSGELPAAGLCVGRQGGVVRPRLFGRQDPDRDGPIRPDALFLVASLTKPVTATAVLLLVEDGALALDDRVAEFVPEFAQNGKGDVRIRHLLTHTSGLPDMLPENVALRAAHAPLSAFVEGACRQPLQFVPGTKVRYQSMGFAVLSEVVRRVAEVPLPEFLRDRLFGPLGMDDTWLGCPPEMMGRVAATRLEPEQVGTDWSWNTPYWLGLGAPWGGLVTSLGDYARFCRLMLGGGECDGRRLLAPATIRAATANQLDALPFIPEEERRCRPWGLGWRLAWPGHSAHFGDLLGPRAFGHWGATGTLAWTDPDTSAFCLIFTTHPAGEDGRYLARVSNAVAAALA